MAPRIVETERARVPQVMGTGKCPTLIYWPGPAQSDRWDQNTKQCAGTRWCILPGDVQKAPKPQNRRMDRVSLLKVW